MTEATLENLSKRAASYKTLGVRLLIIAMLAGFMSLYHFFDLNWYKMSGFGRDSTFFLLGLMVKVVMVAILPLICLVLLVSRKFLMAGYVCAIWMSSQGPLSASPAVIGFFVIALTGGAGVALVLSHKLKSRSKRLRRLIREQAEGPRNAGQELAL